MNDTGPRQQARQRPVTSDEIRKSVRRDVRILKKHAVAAARSPHINDADKAILIDATKLLDEFIDALIKIIDQHEALLLATSGDPEAEAAAIAAGPYIIGGTSYLSSLLYAASAIGNLVLGTSVLRDKLMKKWKERTAAATNAKRAELAKRDDVIWKHADQVRFKHPTWKRWRIAGEIAKPVRSELGRPSLARNTIYTALKNWSDRRSD